MLLEVTLTKMKWWEGGREGERDVVRERGREFVNKTFFFFFPPEVADLYIYTHTVCFLALLSKRRLFFFFFSPASNTKCTKGGTHLRGLVLKLPKAITKTQLFPARGRIGIYLPAQCIKLLQSSLR